MSTLKVSQHFLQKFINNTFLLIILNKALNYRLFLFNTLNSLQFHKLLWKNFTFFQITTNHSFRGSNSSRLVVSERGVVVTVTARQPRDLFHKNPSPLLDFSHCGHAHLLLSLPVLDLRKHVTRGFPRNIFVVSMEILPNGGLWSSWSLLKWVASEIDNKLKEKCLRLYLFQSNGCFLGN